MRISIFGAGYVGSVSGACLAELGHEVVLVDISDAKINLIASGRAPIVEPGLEDLIAKHVPTGRLTATTDPASAVARTDVSVICVGTPSKSNGDLDLGYVIRVCEDIGAAIGAKFDKTGGRHTVIARSTMLPGSMRNVVIPTLEQASGLRAGEQFDVAIYPEFLRESTAIEDFFNPAVMIFGVEHNGAEKVLRNLNEGIKGKDIVVDFETAEAIKYANNAWHAVKITFANEIGNVCKAAGVDGQAVMSIVCMDNRLNISPAYMRPGFAFGGSCLPKDLRALRHKAAAMDVPTPLFDATMRANELQIQAAVDMVQAAGGRRVGMLGLTFKAKTDDLRESPLVELAERLLGKGYALKIYDRDLRGANLVGSNLTYVASRLDHLSVLLTDDLEDVLAHAETIVVGKNAPEFREAIARARPEQHIVDLVRIAPGLRSNGNYMGICW